MSTKILITGAAGFIGSNATRHFQDQGYRVLGLDNLSRLEILDHSGCFDSNWNQLGRLANVELVRGSILDEGKVPELVEDADHVLHTAGQTAVTASLDNPVKDFEVNARGTLNVLEAARTASTPPSVLYCSTNKVYGSTVNQLETIEKENRYEFASDAYGEGIPEDFGIDLTGHSPYGCSKLAGDLYLQDYAETYGLETGVFRMSCVYGPRQMGIEDQGWLVWFALATLLGEPITIYGTGKQVRDVLYVKDLIRCYEAFIESSKDHGVWNVGGGPSHSVSLLEYLDLLDELLDRSPNLDFDDPRPHDQKVYVSDISKAKEDLGWEPNVDLRSGLEDTLNWLRDNRDDLRKFV